MIPLLLLLLFLLQPSNASAASPDPLDKLLARMSVEEKVGQLFMIAIDGEIAGRHEAMIRAGKLGGALARWDKFTAEESRALVRQLRSWTDSSPSKIPILLAADHEGGAAFTQRTYGGVIFPGNMAQGAAGRLDWAKLAAAASGLELRSWGVDLDFAPVVDVNDNPANPVIGLRSFGDDPTTVARLAAASIAGYLSAGMLPTAKHFPGHGNTSTDSHLELPLVSKALTTWEDTELKPFRAAVAAGAPVVMTAHIVLMAVDPSQPATLSSAVIGGYLRRKLGFKGVVISDDLGMDAIAKIYGTPEASLRSFLAGCDILLAGKGEYSLAYERMLAAVRDGTISPKRLDDSVRRILLLKQQARLFRTPRPFVRYDRAAHDKLAQAIAERAVTLLRNNSGILPLKLASDKMLLVVMARSERFAADGELLRDEFMRRHPNTEFAAISWSPDVNAVSSVLAMAKDAEAVVLATFQVDSLFNGEQVALYKKLKDLGKPIVVTSLMNPYDLGDYADASAMLAIYGLTPPSVRALVRVLFGEIAPAGRLPVSIPGLFKRGYGLTWGQVRPRPN